MNRKELIFLDGGMGRELERIGAPFRQPEWSALSLMDGPDYVLQAHRNFIEAGADAITTNAYAVTPFHIGQDRFDEQGTALATLAAKLARQAADESKRPVHVAGCLPPVLGSYRADLFDPEKARPILETLIRAQADFIDFWLAETISTIEEANLISSLVQKTGKDLWLSYTVNDRSGENVPLALRSNEDIGDACRAAYKAGVKALLFNCSQPEEMQEALSIANKEKGDKNILLGAYANAFAPIKQDHQANDEISTLRQDTTPESYRDYARTWINAGARIIGGCCGIGPPHIKALSDLKNT